MRGLGLVAALLLAGFVASCQNMTGDQTVAEYCADPSRQNYDVCENHANTENVRVSLGERIAQVFGVATRAQQTADEANARQLNCATRTLRNARTGSCENGAMLTSCTQTRYTTAAGGMAILRSINDTECRFNARVLEMQVRCCSVGAPIQQVSAPTAPEPQPAPRRSEPAPVS